MAVDKEIRITAKTDQAVKEINKVGTSLDNVEKKQKDVAKQSGKTSEKLKEVGSNGGAIAILDSLTGGLATRMRDAFEASKLFAGSLKGLKGAIAATGIGALVVALGYVIGNWDKIKAAIFGATNELDEHIKKTEELAMLNNTEIALINEKMKLAKMQSKDQRALLLEERKLIGERQVALINQRTELRNRLYNQEEFGRLTAEETQGYIDQLKMVELLLVKTAILREENRQGITPKTEEEKSTDIFTPQVKGIITEDLTQDPVLLRADQIGQMLIDKENEVGQQITDAREGWADKQKYIDEVVAQQRIAVANQTLDTLAMFMKEGSDLGKGFAIAQVVRDQIQSVSQAISSLTVANAKAIALSPVTAGQPMVTFNTIQTGLGIAASVAGAVKAVKDITSDKTTPSGVSPQGAGGGGGGGRQAPSFNLIQGTGTNQINETLKEQKVNKTYVLGRDVTTNQELERNLIATSSL
jgi:hypothetical protein